DAMRQYVRDRDADAHSDHACSLPHTPQDFGRCNAALAAPAAPPLAPPRGTSRRHAETIDGFVCGDPRRLFHSHHHPRHSPLIQPPSLALGPLPPCSTRLVRCRLPRATILSSSTIAGSPTHLTMPLPMHIVWNPDVHELARSQHVQAVVLPCSWML
ncbi:hypothetical protein B0H14DRAFT_2946411, partial [Mycena olivaceomarginata]